MEETARLVIDAMREAGTSMGAPAFEAAVAYTVAWATVGVWLGSIVLVLATTLAVLLFWREDKDLAAAMMCLLPGGFLGVIPIAACLPALWAPEGYLVMDLVTKVAH